MYNSTSSAPGGVKNTNSRFLRFFVLSVPLSCSLVLTPMCFSALKSYRKQSPDCVSYKPLQGDIPILWAVNLEALHDLADDHDTISQRINRLDLHNARSDGEG